MDFCIFVIIVYYWCFLLFLFFVFPETDLKPKTKFGQIILTHLTIITFIIHVILAGVLIGRETIRSLQITAYR